MHWTAYILLFMMTIAGQGGPPSDVLLGRITDQAGNALPGADVVASFENRAGTFRAKTDANGEYVLSDLPNGDATVVVSCTGFRRISRSFAVLAGRNLLDLGLEIGLLGGSEEYHVGGVVTDVSGKPLSRVSVTLRNVYQPALEWQVRTTADGKFELNVRVHGEYVLTAALPGYRAGVSSVILAREQRVSTALRLEHIVW